jgi:hypothetical protein
MERMQRQTRQQPPSDEPVRDNFDSDLAYLEARQDYKIQKVSLDRDEQSRQAQRQAMQASWTQKENEARAKYSDFDEVIAEVIPNEFPPAADNAIATSELGAELLYYLEKNPQEKNQLMQKTNPVDQIRAVGQIEAKIMASKVKPAPKVPAAPAPIKPIGGSGGNVEIPGSKLDDKEWFKRDNERRLAKAGIKT